MIKLLVLVVLLGCEIDWEKEKQESEVFINLFENKKLNETKKLSLFISEAKKDDEFLIEIQGESLKPIFSELTKWGPLTSRWKENECFDNGDRSRCSHYRKQGQCFALIKENLGYQQRSLVFPSNLKKIRLRGKFGKKTFEFLKIEAHKMNKIILRFKVNETMFKESNEFFLELIPPKNIEYEKLGFHSHDFCEGLGHKNFHTWGTFPKTEKFPNFDRYNLSVSALIKQRRE